MVQVKLKELKMNSRNQAIGFLKQLWNNQETNCPICGQILEPLHKNVRRGNCDWQCKKCDKTFKTINLLNEINDQFK